MCLSGVFLCSQTTVCPAGQNSIYVVHELHRKQDVGVAYLKITLAVPHA